MFKKIFSLVFILSLSFSIHAEEKRDLVLRMLEITEAKKNHDLMIKSFTDKFSNDPTLNTEEFRKYFNEAMSWDALIDPIISIYVETYTIEELKAVNNFYASDAGKSFIKKMPVVTKKTTDIVMANVQKALNNLKK